MRVALWVGADVAVGGGVGVVVGIMVGGGVVANLAVWIGLAFGFG